MGAALSRAVQCALKLLPDGGLQSLDDKCTSLANKARGEQRRRDALARELPEIFNHLHTSRLDPCILDAHPPWAERPLKRVSNPGMILPEESRYYTYIGQFYSGRGAAVELGPWLGRSTFYIIEGLLGNPNFKGKKLHVYDDFIWRSEWMDQYVAESDRVRNHGDFLFLFERYTASLKEHLKVEKRRIALYDGNEGVRQLEWAGGPIEIMYVDCGRTIEANEAWYRHFSPYFIPDRTLLVLQDWGTHREVPVRCYNQYKQFMDSKGTALQIVHELRDGTVATFLFRGWPRAGGAPAGR